MDFSQDVLTTVHDLALDRKRLAAEVARCAEDRPAALVLPVHERDLGKPPLQRIATALREATFLNEVVVALTCERRATHLEAARMFAKLPAQTTVVWCESPEVRACFGALPGLGVDLNRFQGKGLAVWLGLGVASVENDAAVAHDADIEDYDPGMLAPLLLPVIDPDLDLSFAKGYYARITNDQLYGRVARLFVAPFLEAVGLSLGRRSPYLRYLRSFRYPLSGEFALTTDLAMNLRIPTDWGIEIGLLAEVYRSASVRRVAQVDLGLYNHKHQPVGATPSEGLQRMASDICSTILRTLTENEGVEISPASLLSLRVMYRRFAQDYLRRYFVEARMNGLRYERHTEEALIEVFAGIIEQAGQRYLADPDREQLPDWHRVLSAGPRNMREELRDASQRALKGAAA